MDTLEKLFGSPAKVRIMKLFLFHPDSVFDMEEVRRRTQAQTDKARKEVKSLEKIGLLKRRTVKKPRAQKQSTSSMKKVSGWTLDPNFPYLKHLQGMLVHTNPFANKEIVQKFSGTGSIKLLVVSGIFIQDWESRVDLLVVGDNLKKAALSSTIRSLEADMGCELRYTVFDTNDFLYRMNVYDKLVRDILDYPHEKIVSKIDI